MNIVFFKILSNILTILVLLFIFSLNNPLKVSASESGEIITNDINGTIDFGEDQVKAKEWGGKNTKNGEMNC